MFGQAVNAELDALATEGLVKDLAEPDLVATNGQTASFPCGRRIPGPGSRQLYDARPGSSV
jgi:Flp pilus assembly secretin CpaC